MIAFTFEFNVQAIIMIVSIMGAAISYICLQGSTIDKEFFRIKKFAVKVSLLSVLALIFIGIILALILWFSGINQSFASFDIHWYAIMIVLGMITAIVFASLMAKKKGLKQDDLLLIAICAIVLGVIGARIWFVVFPGEGQRNWNFADIFKIWEGGLGIYGGIIGGAIGIVIVCIIKKISILTVLDIVAPCVLIAQSFGRWGNFFNQEAYGQLISNTNFHWFPFAVFIQNGIDGAGWYHATFFYESMWNIIGFIGLYIFTYNYDKIKGFGVSGYFLWYGIGRSWIESLRSDALFVPGTTIRVSILFSIIMIVASLGFMAYQITKYVLNARKLKGADELVLEDGLDMQARKKSHSDEQEEVLENEERMRCQEEKHDKEKE